jgi:hypothetical protein
MNFASIVKKPSAFLPIAMSLIVIIVGFSEGARTGFVRQADEGTAAHIFQILMPLQLPIMAFFVIKWLPQAPKPVTMIVLVQIVAALVVLAPVFFFHL